MSMSWRHAVVRDLSSRPVDSPGKCPAQPTSYLRLQLEKSGCRHKAVHHCPLLSQENTKCYNLLLGHHPGDDHGLQFNQPPEQRNCATVLDIATEFNQSCNSCLLVFLLRKEWKVLFAAAAIVKGVGETSGEATN